MALFLKPNPDKEVNGDKLKVFDPERKGWLPAEGAAVPNNAYWMRRVADGDCVDADAPVAEAVAEENQNASQSVITGEEAAPAAKKPTKKGK